MQTNYNEVAVLQQGAGKVTGARKLVKKVNIHMRDIEMSGKMKRLKRKMEVQKITFNYFAWPQPRYWNFFMQWWWWPYKKYCCPVSTFVVGVWDGLDESEISWPEILFQSAPEWGCMLGIIYTRTQKAAYYSFIHVSLSLSRVNNSCPTKTSTDIFAYQNNI